MIGREPPRPDPAQSRQLLTQLRPGCVLRMYQPLAEKVKRHVLIAAMADRSIAFLINTRPSILIERRQEFLRRQLLMPLNEHPFMSHDSYIACHDTVRLPAAKELVEQLHARRIEILGYISRGVVAKIASMSAGSPVIAERDLQLIATNFR